MTFEHAQGLMKKYFVALLILTLGIAVIGSAVYKWVDEEGVTHYSERPPSGRKAKELPIKSVPSEVGEEGARTKPKSWQQQEQEFKQRQEIRGQAEAREDARIQAQAAEQASSCKKTREELAWLLTVKPKIKGREFVPLTDPVTGKEVETMNNAERSTRIQSAEEAIEKWCK